MTAAVALTAPGASPRARGVRRLSRAVRARWRRSLQTRVVVTTLLASAVVVGLLASLLLHQVGSGLIDTKTRTSLSEAQSGAAQAQTRLDNLKSISRQAVDLELADLVQELSDRGAAGSLYSVVAVGTSPDSNAFSSASVEPAAVPGDLRRRLNTGPGPLYAYAPVPDGSGRLVAGLVVGSVLRTPVGLDYHLFHLFPLSAEAQTLGLVQRTAVGAGLVLVGLLALIAGLVARQVVTPVRLAARTAEQLAAGRLEERLEVRGEDELARLATTFNVMAAALQRQIRQLEDLSRVQQRFVSDVSHELRTPLTTVRMAADVLHEARDHFDPDPRRSTELLQAELDRFEELLADLLEISRYDAGATDLEPEPHDLVRLIDRVLDQTAGLAERKGSPVRVHSATPGPVVAEVDAVRVERVLRNLLVNALEHGEGRPVEVTVAGDDSAVSIVVRDHGVGLQPGDAERVFTRFWRGDPSRARATGGTGLGLAIALEDARLHGGRLEAFGRPGRGAAFRLTLPRQAGALLGTDSPLPLPLQAAPASARSDGAAVVKA
ncbi:MAG TPA: MtrAB system histidine kinase MtrB [Mycobacteriales bacterium]|nr:MtrAB system histidine kinase MtrB [Mycobacteriales bacterium]